MAILITGATGLVGARLLPRLIETGFDCRALMRGSNQAPAGATTVAGDLSDPQSLIDAVTGVTAIVHLAAVFRTTDTELIWRSNLEGTRNLIAAAKAHAPGARFVMASTTNIYDADSPRPGREDDTVAPQQAYPASKLAAENLLRESGLNWSILRLAFVYGDRDGHLEALPPRAIEGKWHPAKKMSMIHHRDVAAAVKLALDGVMDGRVVNIADEAPMSMFELLELMGMAMPPSSAPLSNPWHLHVDGSLARQLGFHPAVRTVYQAADERLL
jgi:nucleoside-diphosphate-sugar epimerase